MRISRRMVVLLTAILVRNRALHERLALELEQSQAVIAELQQRLGPGRGHADHRAPQRHFRPIDVYSQLAERGDEGFLFTTRFTQQQFDRLLRELAPIIRRNRRVRSGAEPTGRERSTKATLRNRLLLALKFLVVGGSCESLGLDFGLDKHVVCDEIMHVVYAIIEGLKYEVTWPDAHTINQLIGTFGANFPDVVAIVDNTYTPTLRKRGHWSGHRKQFISSHQVVADAFGFILHVVAGQPGGRHDHHHFALSGVPALLDEAGVRLLGDDAYQGIDNIQTPATRAEMPNRQERVDFNIDFTNRRSRVEQFFSVLKQWFPVAGRKWTRVDRKFLAVVFVACCLLYNRRKRLSL